MLLLLSALLLFALQEEAAAKLAKYRAEVQDLLVSIRKEASSTASSTPVDAQLLYRLADQLFASSINVSEFVDLGGVPVVVEAVRANTRCLTAARRQQQQEIEEEPQPQQEAREAAVLPSMLQVRHAHDKMVLGVFVCCPAASESAVYCAHMSCCTPWTAATNSFTSACFCMFWYFS